MIVAIVTFFVRFFLIFTLLTFLFCGFIYINNFFSVIHTGIAVFNKIFLYIEVSRMEKNKRLLKKVKGKERNFV